ncbi:hypothetical protein ACF0H5_009455 [Mactra antiquata]
MKGLFISVHIIMILMSDNNGVFCRRRRNIDNAEKEFVDHRIKLLEDGMNIFVEDANEKMADMEIEVAFLTAETANLKTTIEEQRREIRTLQWATADTKMNQLTKEEKDLVTELKWTIFDLKNANLELQEDACHRNTECSDWTEWTTCSVSCGSGTKIRSRTCTQSGRFSSMCKPVDIDEEPCRTECVSPNGLFNFDCPEGYSSFQGYCFRFSKRQDARTLSTILCEEEDAHLVAVNNVDKQKVVKDFIDMVAPEYMVDMHEDFSKREYWDFHDIDQKVSVAIDGVRRHQRRYFLNWREDMMTYFNWAIGQPRNDRSDGDYCVTMNVLSGDWYMKCCDVTFFYICETEKRV